MPTLINFKVRGGSGALGGSRVRSSGTSLSDIIVLPRPPTPHAPPRPQPTSTLSLSHVPHVPPCPRCPHLRPVVTTASPDPSPTLPIPLMAHPSYPPDGSDGFDSGGACEIASLAALAALAAVAAVQSPTQSQSRVQNSSGRKAATLPIVSAPHGHRCARGMCGNSQDLPLSPHPPPLPHLAPHLPLTWPLTSHHPTSPPQPGAIEQIFMTRYPNEVDVRRDTDGRDGNDADVDGLNACLLLRSWAGAFE